MTISVTANGTPVMPALDPNESFPEAFALNVAVAEVLIERSAAGLGTRVTYKGAGGVMDTFVPSGAVVQLITNSEIVSAPSEEFLDMVADLRTIYAKAAKSGDQIDLDMTEA
ncbi:hypothetical protein [Micrococcus lylae]|uniref:hypothetical protein n=1 Tax=Micrococcus lylae TaxID=1273 RepID=UPI000C7FF78D|nr:hypothetical protein [Micrococcus lylae]WIK82129.1 hypothetical protein CJ228_011175 [Micrococcus lylae]